MNVIVDGQHEAQKYHQRSVAAPPKQLSTAEERLHADELDACRAKATSVAARSVEASRLFELAVNLLCFSCAPALRKVTPNANLNAEDRI